MMRAATRIYSSFSCSPATTPPPSPPTIPSTSRATFFKSSENAKSGRHPKMAAAIITRIRADTCVGVDAHIAPAAQAAFTEILGEFVALQRGDVGIAPYEKSASVSFFVSLSPYTVQCIPADCWDHRQW